MDNPFKHTEPDFSKDEEIRLQPDGEPYLRKLTRARLDGDFEAELIVAQKMLYLFGRRGEQGKYHIYTKYLTIVGAAWLKLGRIDCAIAYYDEALAQLELLEEGTKDYEKAALQSKLTELHWLAEQVKKLPLRVYIDMDDVLCDYMRVYERELAANPSNPNPQSRTGFYLDLEPLTGAVEAMKWLAENNEIDPFILTAPSVYNPHSYIEKRLWVEKHLGFNWCDRLVLSPDKSIVQSGFLIDDRIEGHGKEKFEGKILQFGSARFANWYITRKYLNNLISTQKCAVNS